MAASRNLSILTRQFSTSNSSKAVVKTPIPVYGIEGRYSAALFSAASKKKALDTVEGDLKKLQGAMKSDARFSQFLLDPTVKTPLKIDGLTGAAKKLGFNDLTKNLLFALAENNRYDRCQIDFSISLHVYKFQSWLFGCCCIILWLPDGRSQRRRRV